MLFGTSHGWGALRAQGELGGGITGMGRDMSGGIAGMGMKPEWGKGGYPGKTLSKKNRNSSEKACLTRTLLEVGWVS